MLKSNDLTTTDVFTDQQENQTENTLKPWRSIALILKEYCNSDARTYNKIKSVTTYL